MHGDFAAGCTVEIEANLNKVSEIERCNPAVKDPCRNGKDQLEAGIDKNRQCQSLQQAAWIGAEDIKLF